MKIITVESKNRPLDEVVKEAIKKANKHEDALVEVAFNFYGKDITMRVAPQADQESVLQGLETQKARDYSRAIWDNKSQLVPMLPEGTKVTISTSITIEFPKKKHLEKLSGKIRELLFVEELEVSPHLKAVRLDKNQHLEMLFKQIERELGQTSQRTIH